MYLEDDGMIVSIGHGSIIACHDQAVVVKVVGTSISHQAIHVACLQAVLHVVLLHGDMPSTKHLI